MRIQHELQAQKEKIKENEEKIKVNKTLPYLVSNVIEVGGIWKIQESIFTIGSYLVDCARIQAVFSLDMCITYYC